MRPEFTPLDRGPRLFHQAVQRMGAVAHRAPVAHPSGRARAQPDPVRQHAARQQLPEFIDARVGHAFGAQSMRQARPMATPGMTVRIGCGSSMARDA
ncbi:MAG: hypothetical protein EBU81_04430 [Proteobacteria bacterium]|nr:hypothetical protein [Pseudomonadota bacterium]